jgi:ornithine cyclodeaminase/alanine dehydrogenase-like protein (mu-crystallin family)
MLTLEQCIPAVEEAFRAYANGEVETRVLSLHGPGGAFHVKAARMGRYFVAKTNANFPKSKPSIQGVVALFDAENGQLLATLDTIPITIVRTGAATAVAAKYLARSGARRVAIIGCGNQGRIQLEALRHVMNVESVRVFDVDRVKADAFGAPVAASVAEAVRDADVIVTCTPSHTPFLRREHVKPGAFIAAVGADNPEKSEIDPDLMRSAAIVVDVLEQAKAMGDLHHAPGSVVRAELGEIVARRKVGRISDDEIIIFDSTGAGFQDVAAAALHYEHGRRGPAAEGGGSPLRR